MGRVAGGEVELGGGKADGIIQGSPAYFSAGEIRAGQLPGP